MKIYIASSWKNEVEAKRLARLMRAWGHEVDCFCEERPGRYKFHYSEVWTPEQAKEMNAIEFVNTVHGFRVFNENKKWIDWSDAVVMLLPCGKSSHLEAGYAKGRGKKLYIVGGWVKGEFDAMYGFADALCTLQNLKGSLS